MKRGLCVDYPKQCYLCWRLCRCAGEVCVLPLKYLAVKSSAKLRFEGRDADCISISVTGLSTVSWSENVRAS